jgi:hypothetical protein
MRGEEGEERTRTELGWWKKTENLVEGDDDDGNRVVGCHRGCRDVNFGDVALIQPMGALGGLMVSLCVLPAHVFLGFMHFSTQSQGTPRIQHTRKQNPSYCSPH